MKSLQAIALTAAVFSTLLVAGGCASIGTAPAGMSETDAKNAIENMKPEDKIRAIASSPMNQKDKDAKYQEIEQQTGVKASDVLGGGPGMKTGAGN